MKLAMIYTENNAEAAIASCNGYVLLETLNHFEKSQWQTTVIDLVTGNKLDELRTWYKNGGVDKLETMPALLEHETDFAPIIEKPNSIWGIGLNYAENKCAITAPLPPYPVTFLKPASALIGPKDTIELPPLSTRTTGESELALIIGKTCKNVPVHEVPNVIAGITTSLDMTEADIHAANPRFLARAKSFDTYISIGSDLITLDDIHDIHNIKVSTILNGETVHEMATDHMLYTPWEIVSYLSQSTTLFPGDIILTGTPGPVVITHGDLLECRLSIKGLNPLRNRVVRLK
ncbi:fumarylacetoacetate hydrolase family protein [Salipaludibacillus agaradhaerens]|uniref:fumarylacetoacetate hydrolase family protein n=1 Tax=Salipaludibacillus agaradhaerens TaxID=76935 RepID=UPI002150799D|nr:fumarylacetoacetate hydrolase family protein [Salipaludibacillus agaradhaerens]MCR6105494.1 fumarylacetoacetate hydrolase family protein [Salipaludibacillus agaradhaerens]MCR6117532.1 fumarylacetoacetate hydrolase family protein [Salipaludibacillus agaradhaerens]